MAGVESPAVALSAMKEMMTQYITGDAARIFDEIRIPVITVNGDLWPINFEANRRHMLSFDAIVLKGADHFLMMDPPHKLTRPWRRPYGCYLKSRLSENRGGDPFVKTKEGVNLSICYHEYIFWSPAQ